MSVGVPRWLLDIRGWFGRLLDLLRNGQLLGKKVWTWLVSHVYALIPVVIAVVKFVYDFICEAISRVQSRLESVDMTSISIDASAAYSSAADAFAVANTILPLDEVFLALVALFTLYVACMIIRGLLSFKKLVLG